MDKSFILPEHQRLAELHFMTQHRDWSSEEEREIRYCMAIAANYLFWSHALEDLSYQAYQMGDVQWHHDICARMEKLTAT